MHSLSRSLVIFVVAPFAVVAQPTEPTAAELMALERFASEPRSRIAWAQEADRISSAQSAAVITAISFEQTTANLAMRGVRIDLQSGAGLRSLIRARAVPSAPHSRFIGNGGVRAALPEQTCG